MSARENFAVPSPASASARAEQTLGQLAVELPGAPAVFRKLKLDFCCGGSTSLRQAVLDKNLDLSDVLNQLNALERVEAPSDAMAPAALIDHIISRYHEVHRVQLPEMVQMARRVESVHQARPNVPAGLADLLEEMQHELLSHMRKEEGILFPLLKAGGNPFVNQPIGMMRAEHIGHGQVLEQIHTLTHDMQAPEGACTTWRALYAAITQFTDDLTQHIHLENNVLFPAFEVAKSADCCGSCA